MFAPHNSPTYSNALVKVTALPDEYDVTDGVQYVDTAEATHFDGHYLRNRSTLDIGVLGYIGIV
jgi:hypothetical protein